MKSAVIKEVKNKIKKKPSLGWVFCCEENRFSSVSFFRRLTHLLQLSLEWYRPAGIPRPGFSAPDHFQYAAELHVSVDVHHTVDQSQHRLTDRRQYHLPTSAYRVLPNVDASDSTGYRQYRESGLFPAHGRPPVHQYG